MNSSKSKIRHIHQANMLLEQRMLNDKRILNEQSNDGWLTYGNDKNYQYKKVGNDWVTKNVKTNKEFNLTQLSNNPKYAGYKTSISNLEKTFPGGKPKGDANANSNVNGTGDVINTLQPKPLETLDGKPVNANANSNVNGTGDANKYLPNSFQANNPLTNSSLTQKTQSTLRNPNPLLNQTSNQVQYKNETLPGAPVYYPWIHDGKPNVSKLIKAVEDNSIYKWGDVLKTLTPEQLSKIRQDFNSSGINSSMTTTKGTGLTLVVNDVLKTAEKSIQTKNNGENNNNDISGSSNPQQNYA